jgi:hypothetical protein
MHPSASQVKPVGVADGQGECRLQLFAALGLQMSPLLGASLQQYAKTSYDVCKIEEEICMQSVCPLAYYRLGPSHL